MASHGAVLAPRRVRHQYRQHYPHEVERVWAQLCPVAEQEWVPGWIPEVVYSVSGRAEVDCVFVTPAEPTSAIWLISDYNVAQKQMTLYKITPRLTVARISIVLCAAPDGCWADIAYMHTSLGPQGDQFLATFTADFYQDFMQN